jgi:cobalt-zinc-cadmium resistance protein CzcA
MIAMSAIPFALIGGILALLIRGYNFNVSAGVGFISLFGISIMAGVLFVSRTRKLIEKRHIPAEQALLKAAVIQLRPNLMAMILAMLGLLPAALGKGIGSDVQRVMATVIVGGLASAILITSFALPPLYYFIERKMLKTHTVDLDFEDEETEETGEEEKNNEIQQ